VRRPVQETSEEGGQRHDSDPCEDIHGELGVGIGDVAEKDFEDIDNRQKKALPGSRFVKFEDTAASNSRTAFPRELGNEARHDALPASGVSGWRRFRDWI